MARKTQNDRQKRAQTFSITVPTALSVQLVGRFYPAAGTPRQSSQGNNAARRTSIKLEPGEHYYRLLVDGEWRDDPHAKQNVPIPLADTTQW